MTRPAARHWAHIEESTSVAGIWLLYGLHRLLGRGVVRALLLPVAAFYWATQPRARAASLEYLRRMQDCHGVFGGPPGQRHVMRHLLSFAETILDKLLAYSGRYGFDGLRWRGLPLMEALHARSQGAILVTAHIGCLELCQAIAARRPGLKLTVLVHTRHAERFNRLLARLRPDNPVRLLQVTEVDAATAVELGARITRGEFVAIAGDRTPLHSQRTAQAPFLGRTAHFPIGAYVLASVLACPLVLLGCVRESGGAHVLHVEMLREQLRLPRRQREQQLQELAALFAQRIEALLVRAPYEWFNFHAFWDTPA